VAVTLRSAEPADADAIADVWRRAWPDGHEGHVSEELVALRTPESFRERAAARVGETTVAEVDGAVAGFVTLAGNEVEQVFVSAEHRGSGIASALLAEAKRRLRARGHAQAWLAVVEGNVRARRFYEREGWVDEGPFDYAADGPDGPIAVPCRRYVKELAGPTR
jgi:GNAT superfamily N-acetyltransferase